MLQREPLKDRASGRWPGILRAIGLPATTLVNKHGPCPICGEGKDRFRFDDKGGRGTWICTHCGAGDGIELVKLYRGCDFKGAARLIEEHLCDAPVQAPRQERTDTEKRQAMVALWRRSQAITLDDPAGIYLNTRTGITAFPDCLRFSADERYTASFHPAMIAKVSDAAGETVNVHRTYLTAEGWKAQLDDPRRMMPGSHPPGSAVRLMEPGEILGIAEGIETAFSAAALFGHPCWAALNAGHLASWLPPEGVKHVFVFGDHDRSFAGQAAANQLAQRLVTKGFGVTVEIPPMPGTDWNDVHQRKRERERA